MRTDRRIWLLVLASIATGVAIGVLCGRGASSRHRVSVPFVDAASRRVETGAKSSSGAEGRPRTCENQCQLEEQVPAATVEVVYADDSTAPSTEVTAAHAARLARRQAAREAYEAKRRDFLVALNLDLLTDEQRKTHELFIEAQKVRDESVSEIRRLRAAGEDIPVELHARLLDAQTVLRTSRDAECGALREAAARAVGLDESAVRQLMEDLATIDGVLSARRE